MIISQDFLVIRKISGEISSFGIQLSYFSWLGIYLGLVIALRSKIGFSLKLLIVVVTLLQIFGNLLFIDRTRPMWIGLPILLAFWYSKHYKYVKIGRLVAILIVMPISIFVLFTVVTGKVTRYGVFDTLSVYLTGSYGYLDALIFEARSKDLTPIRTVYWFSKLLNLAGFDIDVPDQILEFRYVPFLTNVGTFLEPIYSDGGVLFVFILTPLIICFLDYLAISMFRKNTYLSLFFWGNVVFCSAISFFVPKFNQLPIWMFLTVALLCDPLIRRGKVRV